MLTGSSTTSSDQLMIISKADSHESAFFTLAFQMTYSK